MRSFRAPIHLLLALMTLVSAVQAQASTPPATPKPANKDKAATTDKLLDVADDALTDLMAWRTSSARQQLAAEEKQAKSSPALQTAWALLLAQEGKLDQAVSKLEQAATADKNDPAPEYYRGEILYWQRKDSQAAAAWKAASERAAKAAGDSPKDGRAQYYLGAALVRTKRFGEARKALSSALEAGFDSALARYQIGLSYAFEGSWTEAKDELSKVINADQSFAHAYFYRGMAWDKLKRKDKLLVDMDQFVKLAPDAPEAGKARSLLAAAGR